MVGPQIVVVLERALASTLAAGAVTLLVNARGFVLVPAMAAQALGIGVFPAASERYRALGREALAGLALTAIRLSAFIALVSGAYVAICRRELVEVVLERGKFGRSDAVETARLTAIMAPSLLGISIGAVAGRALFAVGRQRLVAVVSAGGIAVYLAFALGLRDVWGVEGLAAAFTFSAIATGGVLAGALARELELSWVATLREWLLAPTALAAAFGAAAWGAWLAVGRGTEGVASALLAIAVVGLAGLAALAAAITATRAREYELLRGLVERAARPRLAPFAG
jgi:putative peptidoglycan lipid II flippase